MAKQAIQVVIPDGLKAGDKFMIQVGMRQVAVEVPPGYRGGQKLQLEVEMQSREELAEIQKALAEAGEGSGWVCLYPLFIDAEVSREKGRRVGLDFACRKPTVKLMADVLNLKGFQFIIEGNKRHPRDFLRPGRLRVHLKKPDGTGASPRQPQIDTRKKLLRMIGVGIKDIPGYEAYLQMAPPPIPGIDLPGAGGAAGGGGGGGGGGSKAGMTAAEKKKAKQERREKAKAAKKKKKK